MSNRVKYGLKNVHFALAHIDELTNTATYDAPKPWLGGVSLELEAQGETTKFRADNIDYWVGQSNNGYSGDLETALVPESFRIDVLGDKVDANGVIIENAGAPTVHFALMFQFEGDENETRYVLYNCTASRPTIAGNTKAESIEPATETLNIDVKSIYNAGIGEDIVKAKALEGSTPYSTWNTTVYQPAGAA